MNQQSTTIHKPKIMKSTIGVIGLGIMGSSIARHMVRAGYQVVGYDVRPARLSELKAAGGVAAASSSDVASQSTILITSLPSSEALAETVVALAQASRRPKIVVETSTLPIEVK